MVQFTWMYLGFAKEINGAFQIKITQQNRLVETWKVNRINDIQISVSTQSNHSLSFNWRTLPEYWSIPNCLQQGC